MTVLTRPLREVKLRTVIGIFDWVESVICENGRMKHKASGRNSGEGNVDPFLLAAIEEAERSMAEGGIPIGSVLVHSDAIVGRGHNRRVQKGSAILHAEMDAIENAGRHSVSFYRACTLYTTLSPCAMCSGAILLYGIPRVVVGENWSFLGEEDLLSERGVRVEVVQNPRCIELMREFAQCHPFLWAEDIGE